MVIIIQFSMKIIQLMIICQFLFFNLVTYSQTKTDTIRKVDKLFKVEKNDGTIYIGKIITQDAREILIETDKTGQIYIPKHEIKSIEEIQQGDINKEGEYKTEEVFATRYFITTNGLPIEKGDNYILWNLYGPEFQFGVGKNFGVGIMTTWLASPLIGTIKYSFNVSERFNLGLGSLLGTGSWAKPGFFMGLPFATATFGDRRSNLNFSAGYGFIAYNRTYTTIDTSGIIHSRTESYSEGRLLVSIAGMAKIGKKISIVFDSFIAPITGNNQYGVALIIPGLRFQTESDRAFQFGFAGVGFNDGSGFEFLPLPVPIVSWFRKL
jgi:hypothetical protein